METFESPYRKLPGWGNQKLFTRSRIWLGKDHILNIDSMGFTEDYKRFYFKDIQAIVTCKTSRGRTINIILATFIFLFVLMAISWNSGFSNVMAFISGFMLLINILLGPTCRCQIYTAVQKEDLPSITRLHTARKVIDTLRTVIESVQGSIPRGEISEKLRNHSGYQILIEEDAAVSEYISEQPESPPAPPVLPVQPVSAAPPLKRSSAKVPYTGYMFYILFILLLLLSGITAIGLYHRSRLMTFVQLLFFAGVFFITIIGIIIQRQKLVDDHVRKIIWIVLSYMFICCILMQGFTFLFHIEHPGVVTNQPVLDALSSNSILESTFFNWFTIFTVILTFFCGAAGLVLFHRYRYRLIVPPPLTAHTGKPADGDL